MAMPSLVVRCLFVVTRHMESYTEPALRALPTELISLLLSYSSQQARLTDRHLLHLTGPSPSSPQGSHAEALPAEEEELGASSRVTSIRLPDARRISDQGWRELAKKLRGQGLKGLTLSRCWQIKSDTIAQFAKHCGAVAALDVSQCIQLDDQALHSVSGWHSSLTYLDLSSCHLVTDMGMMWVAQYCTQLRSLNIVSCVQLTDATINAIAKGCTSLTSLDISNCCKITSLSLINVASSSPDLLSFKADGCYQITEDLLYEFAKSCKQLQVLSLRQCNQITDSGIEQIMLECEHLRELALTWCPINSLGMEKLKNTGRELTSLVSLDISWCHALSNQEIRLLSAQCPNLRTLNLSWLSGLTDDTIREVVTQSLTSLDISGSGSNLTAEGFAYCGSSSLQVINLSWGTKVTDESWAQIVKNSPNLRSIDISLIDNVHNETLALVSTHCTNLQALSVSRCSQFTDEAFEAIISSCKQLYYLHMSSTHITDTTLGLIARNCQNNLRILNLVSCPITDEGVSHVVNACPFLMYLDVSSCTKLTSHMFDVPSLDAEQLDGDEDEKNVLALQVLLVRNCNIANSFLKEVGRRCPVLHTLSIANCRYVTDEGLHELAGHKRPLQSIDLLGCASLNDWSCTALVRNCPTLRTLNVSGCRFLTDQFLLEVSEHSSCLLSLDVSTFVGHSPFSQAALKHLAEAKPLLRVIT